MVRGGRTIRARPRQRSKADTETNVTAGRYGLERPACCFPLVMLHARGLGGPVFILLLSPLSPAPAGLFFTPAPSRGEGKTHKRQHVAAQARNAAARARGAKRSYFLRNRAWAIATFRGRAHYRDRREWSVRSNAGSNGTNEHQAPSPT
jgi:hypothetical protein